MKRKFEITDASGGAAFSVRVVTRAARTEVVGIQDDGVLKVRLTSAPEDGANQELITLLAEVLEVDAGTLEIVAGEKGRDKLISVDGIAPEILEERLLSTSGGSE
jgi:uncharacterized protein (TIGR00251 family)